MPEFGKSYHQPALSSLPFMTRPGEAPPIVAGDANSVSSIVVTGHAKVFDMLNVDDAAAYVTVLDKVAKRTANIRSESTQWIPEDKKFVVFLTWYEGHREFIKSTGTK